MNTLKSQHVKDCFENGDQSLGIRRLIDCVMDTDNLAIQQNLLELLDVFDDKNSIDPASLGNLIEKLTQFTYVNKAISAEALLDVNGLSK